MSESRGVLVITDCRMENFKLLQERFVPVLDHWKLPYRLVDIQDEDLNAYIKTASLILLIQEGVGKRLPKEALIGLSYAGHRGVGLMVAEPSIWSHPFVRLLGDNIPSPKFRSKATTKQIKVLTSKHFITSTKNQGELIHLAHSVKLKDASKLARPWETLVSSGRYPVLSYIHQDQVRLGWLNLSSNDLMQLLGFGTDLDILYRNAIIFLAKKPLAQLLPPRFSTVRIEDCVGEGRFRYLDTLVKRGFKVHLGLDLNDFDYSAKKKLHKYSNKRKVEFSPHAFTHYKKTPTERTELIYGEFDGSESSKKRLDENFKRLKQFEKKANLHFSPVLTYHYCQLGKNATPYLKKMGVRYLTFPFRSNVALKKAETKKWRRHPFGKLGFVCDVFPDDKDLFSMVSHAFPDEGMTTNGHMDVSKTSKLDFLFGLRLKTSGKRFSQYEEAAERVSKYARRCFENLFFANIFTHETNINYLKPSEFKKIVKYWRRELKRWKTQQALYQDIADYYEKRSEAKIEQESSAGDEVAVKVQAAPKSKLHLAIYRDSKNGIKSSYRELKIGSKKSCHYVTRRNR